MKTKTKAIHFLQLNTNHSNTIGHTLLNELVKEADVLLINEPWFGNIGNEIKGPVAHPSWMPILPVTHLLNDTIPRAMAYIQKRDDFIVTLRSDLAHNADMQILEIAQPPHPKTLIINIYNQQSNTGACQWTFECLMENMSLPTNVPSIITDDLNMHHPMWGGDGVPAT